MTLVSLSSTIYWPNIVGQISGTPNFGSSSTLTAAGHYFAMVLVAKEDMVISHVGWRNAAVSGSPTADVRIETVDSSGFPSGTLWGTNTNIVSGTLSANTFNLSALTASASITKGQIFCVKIAYNSGTNFIVSMITNTGVGSPQNEAAYFINNTGTPTKSNQTGSHLLALGSSSTTFYQVPTAFPAITIPTTNTFNNTSGARRGLRFTIPFNCRAIGVKWNGQGATGDFNIGLWDDAGSEVGSSITAFTGAQNSGSNTTVRIGYFDNAVSLTAGTTYRIALEPTTATNCSVTPLQIPSTSYRGAVPGGTAVHYTTYASGAWTDTATDQVPQMDLVIDQVDNGSGSGGGGGSQRVISG